MFLMLQRSKIEALNVQLNFTFQFAYFHRSLTEFTNIINVSLSREFSVSLVHFRFLSRIFGLSLHLLLFCPLQAPHMNEQERKCSV